MGDIETGSRLFQVPSSPLAGPNHREDGAVRMKKLLTPSQLGRVEIQNRVVMARMTSARANADGTHGKLAAEYCGQRAGIAVIVTEGTQPSDDGQGYPRRTTRRRRPTPLPWADPTGSDGALQVENNCP
ncbi:hypothetical protein GmRootA79_37330 [Acidovorax sp. A79]